MIAGRSIPGSILRTNLAVAIRAPVLPALTQASASPSFTRLMATRMEESFFFLRESAGGSDIPTTSVALRIESRESSPAIRVTCPFNSSSSPTRISCRFACRSRQAFAARTTISAPRSPLIASSEITDFVPTKSFGQSAREIRRDPKIENVYSSSSSSGWTMIWFPR